MILGSLHRYLDNPSSLIVKIFIAFFWIFIITLLFDKFAYYIDNFNASLRVLITKGSFKIREFDQSGIPYSFSPRINKKFISPFYVVHYGLIYSQIYKKNVSNFKEDSKYLWKLDKTLSLWNVPPKLSNSSLAKKYFINSARWVIENLKELKGQYHLLYDFEWQYKGYPGEKLNPPWYSGLTNSYAIILLLRAYDITKEEIYKDTASKLYRTVTTSISNGGALNHLNGLLWIEEYIDPKVKDYSKLPYVLNGMIYAFYGVLVYEDYFKVKNGISKDLLFSLYNLIDKYNLSDRWSYYDLIGSVSNIKYHRIHVGLLEELISIVNDFSLPREKFEELHLNWKRGLNHPGFYFLLFGNRTFGYFHFLVEYIFLIALSIFFIFIRG